MVGMDLERKDEVVGLGMGTTQVGEEKLNNEKRRSRQNRASRVKCWKESNKRNYR